MNGGVERGADSPIHNAFGHLTESLPQETSNQDRVEAPPSY